MADLLLLAHSKTASVGTSLDWCVARGVSYQQLAGEELSTETEPSAYRGVIVFGGDMEIWQTDKYHWLKTEKEFLGRCLKSAIPIFGICMGAQLLAEQLGSAVKDMGSWEIGWFPVKLQDGRTLTPMHFHSSRFSMTPHMQRLVAGAEDANQGFRSPGNNVGFQFHTEIDERRLKDILSNRTSDKTGAVQSKAEIVEGFKAHSEALQAWYFRELDHWWSEIARK